jgi:hypothetical protein
MIGIHAMESRTRTTTKHLRSISSTFYNQLLCAQIPNAQKDSQVVSLLWRF